MSCFSSSSSSSDPPPSLPFLPSSSPLFSHLNSLRRVDNSLLYLPYHNNLCSFAYQSQCTSGELMEVIRKLQHEMFSPRWGNQQWEDENQKERDKNTPKETKCENPNHNGDTEENIPPYSPYRWLPSSSSLSLHSPGINRAGNLLGYGNESVNMRNLPNDFETNVRRIENSKFTPQSDGFTSMIIRKMSNKRIKIDLPNQNIHLDSQTEINLPVNPNHQQSTFSTSFYPNELSRKMNNSSPFGPGNALTFPLPDFPVRVDTKQQSLYPHDGDGNEDNDTLSRNENENERESFVLKRKEQKKSNGNENKIDNNKTENIFSQIVRVQVEENHQKYHVEDEENDNYNGDEDADDDDILSHNNESDGSEEEEHDQTEDEDSENENKRENDENDDNNDRDSLYSSDSDPLHFDTYALLHSTYHSHLTLSTPLSSPLISIVIEYLSGEESSESYEEMISLLHQLGEIIYQTCRDMNRIQVEIPRPITQSLHNHHNDDNGNDHTSSSSSLDGIRSKLMDWFTLVGLNKLYEKPIHHIQSQYSLSKSDSNEDDDSVCSPSLLFPTISKVLLGTVCHYISEDTLMSIYHFIRKWDDKVSQSDHLYSLALTAATVAKSSYVPSKTIHNDDDDDDDENLDHPSYLISADHIGYLTTQAFSPHHFHSLSHILQDEIDHWQDQCDIVDKHIDLWMEKLHFTRKLLHCSSIFLGSPSGGIESVRNTDERETPLDQKKGFKVREYQNHNGSGGEEKGKENMVDDLQTGKEEEEEEEEVKMMDQVDDDHDNDNDNDNNVSQTIPFASAFDSLTYRLSSMAQQYTNTKLQHSGITMVAVPQINGRTMSKIQMEVAQLLCKYLNHLDDIHHVEQRMEGWPASITLFPPDMNDYDMLVETCRFLFSLYYCHFMYRDMGRDWTVRDYNECYLAQMEQVECHDIIINKKIFKGLVCEMLTDLYGSNAPKISEEALLALQEGVECYLVEMFSDVMIVATNEGGGEYIPPSDIFRIKQLERRRNQY